MAFIRARNLKRNETGAIVSGTASILRSVYDAQASGGHSRQEVVEKLGRVLELADDGKSGTFLSPTRGLISYDVTTDEFARVSSSSLRETNAAIIPAPEEHVAFGDVFLLACFLRDCGLLKAFHEVFPDKADYERFIVHLFYELLREGSHEKCDFFFRQSALSMMTDTIVPYTLRSDSRFFELMGWDAIKSTMFRALADWMRAQDPTFGQACYVDSSPLPNDVKNLPYNHLRCQDAAGCSIQSRLALVLDEKWGFPVWFEIFPGNQMDVSTLKTIITDVEETIDITVASLVLDSGYVSAELLKTFGPNTSKSMIARMPDRKGYPYRELYHRAKPQMASTKYDFERNGHIYFGQSFNVTIQNQPIWAYVMLDRNNALEGYSKFCEEHEARFTEMKDKDKQWRSVEAGFFILLSDRNDTCAAILEDYISRASVEATFKDSKTFLRLMPLSKWTPQTVKGKILMDIVADMVRTKLLRSLPKYRGALNDLFDEASAVRCFPIGGGQLHIETPNKQARGVYKLFDKVLPGRIASSAWRAVFS